MLNKLWAKEKVLISLSGLIAALSALFLDIPVPQIEDAKIALANVQFFWLVLLTISLTKLFFSLIDLTIKTEKEIKKKYDLPIGVFSMTLATILLMVLGNFWKYIFDLYGKSFWGFMDIVFPELVAVSCVLLLLFVEKKRSRFTRFSYIIVLSFVLGLLIGLAGIYIQEALIGYFYFYWLNLIFPGATIIVALGLMIFSYLKKKPLFSALPKSSAYGKTLTAQQNT
ncbi:MAG: hypothetical protein LiPW15_333 [Parcubacteria group bacterium LiPW_15]|nr:MAG: hypothetical protein LiPW15_333 [Parcubacteria group bacterium LiPW_15]